ncbi:hypothetical protein Dret_1626 [Desulfohalobium retbaense DSM 5692]|uniref:Uncharacterized protein n=1 Tax=Desulfohalobium retbaense (strain ATCC 49708 / DSM 5692 / JCM 16813 / HR100) TaxID=485915 RepID=C8X3B3_DESRD|nr:hypothetical protein Dret_1626 [Desulfohalobium retbaense DSM 5692]
MGPHFAVWLRRLAEKFALQPGFRPYHREPFFKKIDSIVKEPEFLSNTLF